MKIVLLRGRAARAEVRDLRDQAAVDAQSIDTLTETCHRLRDQVVELTRELEDERYMRRYWSKRAFSNEYWSGRGFSIEPAYSRRDRKGDAR